LNRLDPVSLELPQIAFVWPTGPTPEESHVHEWLVTNGQGGYAAGTLGSCPTRRYHGLFIPTLPRFGRTVMLARLQEEAVVEGRTYRLDGEQHVDGTADETALQHLRAFRLRGLIPEWEFELGKARLLRRLVMVHGENTLFIAYQHLSGPSVRLSLRPFPLFRPHEGAVGSSLPMPVVRIQRERIELMTEDTHHPPLHLRLYSRCPVPFIALPAMSQELLFRLEKLRGYAHGERQYSPGYFECVLSEGETLTLGVTSQDFAALEREPLDSFRLEAEREQYLLARAPAVAREGLAARLVLAADQFVIDPVTRPKDEAWARAIGQDARSVIAGYPWFTDWGRDTMISLEGLTLATGRTREAAAILRTFTHYVRDGLLPNLFPEGEHDGLYHTADATLWYFHAVDRYLGVTGDLDLVRDLFPTLESIIDHHLKGTHFHIGVDPVDGLLHQGEPGYQLTWMDAKVDGWVVTPRRGKAVEINALWFNALRLMCDWAERLGRDPQGFAGHAERVQGAFNRRFWNEKEQCLLDVVDAEGGGDDAAVRPNQIFALSLRHPVLRRERWAAVLRKVEEELLTPVGLRSLSPKHKDYQAHYDGDLRARDAAYHQGTVWAWLIGHYLDAKLRLDPDKQRARDCLRGLEAHLAQACVGQISEIFDATAPYRPRGCVAQAWSIAELMRAWLKTS